MKSKDQDSRACGSRMARATEWAVCRYRAVARAVVMAAILLALGVCLPVSRVQAGEASGQNDLCFGCHSEKSMTAKRAGRTISLFVDGKKFSASVHNSLSCTSCHADLEGADLPHSTPKKVQCGTCHAQEQELHA